jgi:predicted negative regulator of RcsB-dependent stress response
VDVYTTEEQQLEAIKKWWKKYGSLVLSVVLAISVMVAGVRYWQHHTQVVSETASLQFDQMMKSLKDKDKATAVVKAEQLINEYDKTPYASLAALMLAKEAVEEKDFIKATSHLQWVLEHAKVSDFKFMARTRLARILIDENKLDEALAMLTISNMNGYETLIEELKGDIYLAQNKVDDAKQALTRAWQSAPESAKNRLVLRMKLEDLGLGQVMEMKRD